ncbi:type II toxin-antitoxin system PemK/MazF family toxin [Bosea sp. PAMC 26642]|uniref:type II toxin-antitoxin system PemK/MazF family toxin n=1 Tax=Bosea sp. (strain PAMC 26642) TaxID=1792307 RepID=UPI00076FE420|nr:type II toxin-antitoxin system PemK/MazF family toxin [Bosea sp. PAMC 26642]AMJ60834.1 hypothetical protein AXW83_11500 [Bosea sp. PAMC 26642]
MSIVAPEPGLVIRYAYLWRDQAASGRVEASKDRPCAVVLTTKRANDKTVVVVAPITHARPRDPSVGIEIPAAAKARLGLDVEPSWVITNDLNYFTWPGPDIRPVTHNRAGRGFVYGQLSQSLTNRLIANVRERLREGRSQITGRNEGMPPRES